MAVASLRFRGAAAAQAMRTAGAPKEYLTSRQPLVNLIDALSKRKGYRQIVIQKGDMLLSLNRGAPAS